MATEDITEARASAHHHTHGVGPRFTTFAGLWTTSLQVARILVTVDANPDHVYIREAAELLHRRMGTLRKWEQTDVLPEHLRSHRGDRSWRFWTREQIEGIKEWIRETERYSGNALPNYNPTEKQLDKAINAMRRPHSSTRPRLEA